MTTRQLVGLTAVSAVLVAVASAQAPETIRLPQAVLADGQPLAPGTYQVRVTDQSLAPAPGQTAGSERWVEFVKNGTVAGREVATVIPDAEIAQVAKGTPPRRNTARVEMLKGGDYVRVWLNRDGTHFLVNLPIAAAR